MQNKIASILFGIGVATIGIGVIGSLFLGFTVTEYYGFNFGVFLAGSVASLVSGMIHIGFAEIINLLQQSVEAQKEVALLTDVRNTTGKNASTRIVDNIEAELPKL